MFDCRLFIYFLISYNRYDKSSRAAVVAVFVEIDALPRAEVQPAVGDGDGEAYTAQNRFCMSRHVVQSFEGMLIVGTAFGYQAVEDGLHIDTHIGVAVLVDAESATGVLGEDVHDAGLRERRQLA